VGTFYGYTFETPWRESCHHSLDKVLECDEIDFLCSPVSYASDRQLGRDHACMLPCDSLKAHGKLYFSENDTRTHLTRIPFPELPYFQNPVFKPKRYDDAIEMLKLHYCRSLIHGYAHWWFDMWGGCYNDPIYMGEMREFLEISKDAVEKPMGSVSELAVFIDEKCYKYCKNNHSGMSIAYHFRDVLGKIGTPYDVYLASDYELVKERYKAVILLEPHPTELLDAIFADAKSRGVGCYKVGMDNLADTTTEVFRKLCRESGVHIYVESDAVVFANESYIYVHCEGQELPKIRMRDRRGLKSLFESEATKPMHTKYISALYEFV
jgi:beta-galactosidase